MRYSKLGFDSKSWAEFLFVMDMGLPVKIIGLIRRMVERFGMAVRDEQHPHGDIGLIVTGLRPDEKLYDVLRIGNVPRPTQHLRITKAHK